MKSFGVTSVLVPTLVLASLPACEAKRQVLQPSALCSDHLDAAIATFEDANLEARVRSALSVPPQQDLTCGMVSGLRVLDARRAGIGSFVGGQNLTSLTRLQFGGNSVTDISALSGLTSLTALGLSRNSITDISALSGLTSLDVLSLWNNSITDISPLSGLTSLTSLGLVGNSITDIQPLLDNMGLGAGDTVDLSSTSVSCTDVALLEAKGATVVSDCP